MPGAGARGRSPQAAGGRVAPGQNDAPGHRKKKVVSPDQQRAAADYLDEKYGVSQRRICRVMDRPRSGLRYHRKRRADQPALNREIKRLARRHPRYGYRMIHALLVRKGWSVNIKRVRRLWISLGPRKLVRLRKPRKLGPKPGVSANSCVQQPAQFEQHLDLRLHPRPHGRGWFPQVANLGGRIYSGVLSFARGWFAHGGRCSADHGPGNWSSRRTDTDQER